jgi:hypothetical protein
MTPGRELDAVIAEKVMGWTRLSHPYGEQTHKTLDGRTILADFLSAPDGMKLPHYSTDISAAWEVVEKLRELGWYLAIHSDPKRGYFATIPRADGIQIESETAPHAICLAALKAKEV